VYRSIIMIILLSLLYSCSSESSDNTISLEVTRGKFVMRIPIKGELVASKATPISMPSGVFEPQMIAWLAEENSMVRKGDVIVRFDTNKYLYDNEQTQLELDQVDISYAAKENVLFNEKDEIDTESNLITDEMVLAERFALEDFDVFSKNEIIDSMRNKQYLEARKDNTDWRSTVHEKKSSSELDLLELERKKHGDKLKDYQVAMDKMEIRAPHDGLFILDKDRHGEKPRVGDLTWPGRKMGSLPDMKKLQAKVNILESEAAGLARGLSVQFTLDAYPDAIIEGTVERINAIAKPIERGSPVKYFEAIVAINSKHQKYWRPGVQLRGRIFVIDKNDVISIPSQAIFLNQSTSYVYLKDGNQWVEKQVVIGSRSLSVTEILSGIEVGNIIALYKPEEEIN